VADGVPFVRAGAGYSGPAGLKIRPRRWAGEQRRGKIAGRWGRHPGADLPCGGIRLRAGSRPTGLRPWLWYSV